MLTNTFNQSEIHLTLLAFVINRQLRFEEEILTLQEQLESADMENAD